LSFSIRALTASLETNKTLQALFDDIRVGKSESSEYSVDMPKIAPSEIDLISTFFSISAEYMRAFPEMRIPTGVSRKSGEHISSPL
jgi:hypothetical protein